VTFGKNRDQRPYAKKGGCRFIAAKTVPKGATKFKSGTICRKHGKNIVGVPLPPKGKKIKNRNYSVKKNYYQGKLEVELRRTFKGGLEAGGPPGA